MQIRFLSVFSLILLPTLLGDSATPIEACATVTTMQLGHADISSESAIIVWDSRQKVQHFIRRAIFTTAETGEPVTDFGFLVPTPTQPEIAAIDDSFFDSGHSRLTL